MIRRVACLLLLAAVLAFNGCAARTIPAKNTNGLYGKFRAAYSSCNATGMKSTASLYYTSQGKGHRTTMTLWGDLTTPLRLDVRAGIGAYLAHIREDASGLTAFYPDQKTAYVHSSPSRGVKMLGLPFPFSLKDLAGLISGCYQSLIPEKYTSMTGTGEDGNLLFVFKNGPVSAITLTAEGIPTAITGRGEIPWNMELADYENDGSGKMLPGKITVFTGNGDKAILRVKSRNLSAERWPDGSMEMDLPEGTQTVRLDRNGYDQEIN
ncbi:hypothetical protein [Maridesulfovibrio sp. FT414]|uniref:hypothetical protein n=1 Tax=Maridesulfovibrio sp. FT414 TaxID=2979469 RepID=UPI003D808B98